MPSLPSLHQNIRTNGGRNPIIQSFQRVSSGYL